MKTIRNNSPWRDDHGNHRSTEEIKSISCHWSPVTWERYLKSLEGGRQEELLLNPGDVEHFSAQECYPQIHTVNGGTVKTYPSTNKKFGRRIFKKFVNVTDITKVNYAATKSI